VRSPTYCVPLLPAVKAITLADKDPEERTMKLPRRRFLRFAAGAAVSPLAPRLALAQAYPTRPVRIVVGFPPGGSVDIAARLIGQSLSERMGQQFIIENRPGAGSNIGTEAVVRAPADGYTLLLSAAPNAINATLYDKLNFDFMRDTAPVASIMRAPNVMEVHPSVPAKTVPEFIAYAKANPGKITMASTGIGTSTHLSGELFKVMAGVDMVHVPYRGNAPALTDLIAGQVQVLFDSISTSIEHVRTGRLRGLAVTGAARSPVLPDLPIVADFVPGYEASAFFGVSAPRNTPVEIIARLNKEIGAVLADPGMKTRLVELGGTIITGSAADFGKLVADETEKWGKVIRSANIKAE
jgi:tripartite-type tricarboxylate transporter receptor subunit TctC